MAIFINEENFNTEIEQSNIPVILDIYADWCPPCQMMMPVFDELEKENSDKYKFAKLNVDEARELSITLGISSVPTLIFFKDGNIVAKIVGYKNKEELKDLIKKYL